MLFEVWGGDVYRPTQDLDLLGFGSPEPERIEACFHELSTLEIPDDGLRFHPDKLLVRRVREDAKYSGVEVKLALGLYKARIQLKVDFGFGDVIVPGPQEVGPSPRPIAAGGRTMETRVVDDRIWSLLAKGLDP